MRGRTDKNQAEIVKVLRQVGATVTDTSQVGNGFPDLVVGYRQQNFLLEVKRNDLPIRLTSDQKIFHEQWRGKVHLVRNQDDALQVIGITK